MNGFEAGRLIREMFPSCRIILFSGQALVSELLDTFKSEGPGFEILSKPVEPKVLLAYLSGAVAGFNAYLKAQNAP